MKAKDMREKSLEDLRELEKSIAGDHFQAKLKNFTNRLDDTSSIRKLRKDAARVKTILAQAAAKAKAAAAPAAKAAPAKAAPRALRSASKAASRRAGGTTRISWPSRCAFRSPRVRWHSPLPARRWPSVRSRVSRPQASRSVG